MVKINFNGREYIIDETMLSAAKSALLSHLNILDAAGDGNIVTFDDVSYNIGGADFNTAKTVVDAKLIEYNANPSAFSDAVEAIAAVINGIKITSTPAIAGVAIAGMTIAGKTA